MAEQSVVPERRISTEFVALMSFAVASVVALLSLVVWLDGKFEQFDAKFVGKFEQFDAKFEGKFEQFDAKFEGKFEQLDAKFEGKFEQFDAKIEGRFEQFDAKFERRFEKLHRKIEDLGAELRSDISVLRAGQGSLDKRLAVVESHVLGMPQSARPENLAAPAS